MRSDNNWISTYTGVKVYPFDPRPEEINITDIAHALSNVCRFSGHTREFYSVAQHSILVSQHVPAPMRLAALLHDASEAYICDLSRPIKHTPQMQKYRDVEKQIMAVIQDKFQVNCDQPEIHEADNRVLLTEKRELLPTSPSWGTTWAAHIAPYAEIITPWTPALAKIIFLQCFATYQ